MFLAQATAPPAPPAVEVSPLIVTGVKPGAARLSCGLRFDRSLERCVVVSADPPACGFGTAALRLAEHMHLDAAAARGARAGRVEIPLSFSGIGGCPRPGVP